MASHTCPGSADTWNVGVGWGLHLSAPRGQCAQHRGVVGSSNGQLGEGGASRSVMSLRLAPGAHWGVAYLCLQPGSRLRPPLAPLHAPPTTPGCSPGSAHHPWLLPRLCPPSRLLPSPRPPHLAPPQALPIVPGSSPGPAHSPERPVARCTSGRRSHSAALLLAHVAGTGPSTAVPETRPDGLVWWPGHRALTEAEFPQTRKAQARADVVRPREARPPRGRGGWVGSVPGCLPLCVPEGGRGLDRSARGHGWHPERAGTRCRRLTTLARRGGLGRERPRRRPAAGLSGRGGRARHAGGLGPSRPRLSFS